MKIALVTTPPTIRSGIGDYTRHLLPYLREHCEVELFVAPGLAGSAADGTTMRSTAELSPRDFDQIVYQLGNEMSHAFMATLVQRLGGVVVQHDWVLFDMALTAWPALARGGWKGHLLALREGGPHEASIYNANWRDRRRGKILAESEQDRPVEGIFTGGWHDHEGAGRWTSDRAGFFIQHAGARSVCVHLTGIPGRTVRLFHAEETSKGVERRVESEDCSLELELDPHVEHDLVLETRPIAPTTGQRANGDARRLGSFVRSIEIRDASGVHTIDLTLPAARPARLVDLTRDRFRLALNRTIVRNGDAFIVHSREMKQRILRERNAATPVGVVYHGAEKRWRDEARVLARERLGLPRDWSRGLMIASLGSMQRHKRIDRLLEGLALARRARTDIRLALVGAPQPEDVDVETLVRSMQLEDAVRITGYLPEEESVEYLHAADLCVNLRGPSTGGTSGGIFQALSLGRAVIASDLAEQSELPGSCILKVKPGEGEAEAIARHLVELRDHPGHRVELEASARRFVETECHWSITARRYADILASFPAPRAKKKSLIRSLIEISDRRRTVASASGAR